MMMADKKESLRTSKTMLWASNGVYKFKEHKGMMLAPKVIIDNNADGTRDYDSFPSAIGKSGKVCYALPGGGHIYL